MAPQVVTRRLRRLAGGAILALAAPWVVARAQGASGSAIDGSVKDAVTGAPLPNAQVMIAGTTIGTATGPTGTYRLTNVPVGTVELRVRLIGYAAATKSVPVALGQTARADFALTQSALQLEAVVTTGTGAAVETKKLGNTDATVDLSDLKNAPIQNPSEALAARVPGVSVLPSSGMTGAGARIRIRGSASLSQSNNPIIYIDGVRSDNGGSGVGGGVATSRLDDIDPSSIERVEILKGAAAATLYGTEASNGVIQIFTKKGAQGAAKWTLDLEHSRSSYPHRVAPNTGFARTQAQADSLGALFGQTITPYKPFGYDVTQQLFNTGYNNTVNGSVSGGTDKVTYFGSGRYQFEDGPFTSDKLGGPANDIVKRSQGTINLNIFPREKVSIGVQSRYSLFHIESPEGTNSIYSPYAQSMYARPDQGYCTDALGKHSLSEIAGPGRCKNTGNPFGNTLSNTLRESLQHQIYQDGTHFNGSIDGKWTPSTQFNFSVVTGIDNTTVRGVSFVPFGNALDRFSLRAPDGSRSVDDLNQQNVTLDVKGNWDRQVTSAFRSTLTLGGQGFITDQKQTTASNRNFPGPGLEVVGAGNQPSTFEGIIKVVNAGYFAEEKIGFNDWVFGNVGARYDYNSAFGESAGGVLYPKASISIVPSDRPGWNSSLVSSLRLRAAIGKSGRQPGAFDKFTTYSPLAAATGGGLIPSNLGNPDLKPEVSTEIEGGAEIGLLQDRLSLTITNWNRKVTDVLVQKQFAISGGFTARQLTNIGEMTANGWELGANGFVVNRPNLGLELFANGAYLKQTVTSLGGAPPIKIQANYVRIRGFIREGYAPGALFGAKLLSPCSSYANPTQDAKGGCLQAGETPYDLNNDGKPDTEAQVRAFLANPVNPTALKLLRADDDGNGDFLDHYQGKPMPDWQGAFGGNLRIGKRWRLASLFEYKAGNFTITDLTDAFRNASPALGRNRIESTKVEATLLNPASTPEQRYDAAKQWLGLVALSPYDGLNQNKPGDFIRWRELTLTYTAPTTLAKRIGAGSMTLTVGARNLLLWTKYSGTDPEINYDGISSSLASNQIDNNFYDSSDTFGLPMQRRFTFSVRLGF
jgi:TonB-linked SusC/RagA family outer membrane protein